MPGSRISRVTLATFLSLPAIVGCSALTGGLTSKNFALAVLINTPTVQNPTGSMQMVPGITAFSLFFAEVDPSQVTSTAAASGALTPDDTATVTLSYTDATTNKPVSITVPSTGKGQGSYLISSTDAAGTALQYESEVLYTVTISNKDSSGNPQTFVLQNRPPAAEKIKEFESSAVLMSENVSSGFTITRDCPPAANCQDPTTMVDPLAFVAMQEISSMTAANPSPTGAGLTYTNAPADAIGFLNLLLAPAKWETDTFTIPATAFTGPSGTPYAVTMTPVQRGANPTTGGNLPLFGVAGVGGSDFLVGQASAGVVVTK